ncbi:MAG: hypothetical protein FWH03_03500 [Firmicutes bacterium]|nr:hypothetical protein [Bacillota bacterium]
MFGERRIEKTIKKTITKILTMGMILIMGLGIFAGCGNNKRHPNSDPDIETELEIKIRQNYIKKLPKNSRVKMNNLWVSKYYGTFDESVVLIFQTSLSESSILPDGGLGNITKETIAGFEFIFGTSSWINVWYNGNFYSLLDAYNDGLLTSDDIESIWLQRQSKN